MACHRATDGMPKHVLLKACKGLSCYRVAGTVRMSTGAKKGKGVKSGQGEGEEEEKRGTARKGTGM